MQKVFVSSYALLTCEEDATHIYRERKGEAKKYEAFLLNFQESNNEAFSVAVELEYFLLFTQVG